MTTNAVAVATLTRAGTAAPPKNGTTTRNESIRANASPTSTRNACGLWPTSNVWRTVSSRRRNSSIYSNADADLEHRVEDAARELAERAEHPAGEDDEDDD